MSYKDKPQIKLYKYESNSFVLQAIIDDFQECSFEHNIYEAGTFTITINYNIPNALLFQRGLFCQFGNNPYDFGEIITIQDAIGQDGKGSQIRTITGRDSRYILKRRVIKNMNSNGLWAMTDKGELVLRNLIKDQCGSSAETKRQLPISNTIPASSSAIGKDYSVSEQFTNLYEVCKTIATQSEIGWRFAFDGSGLTLEVFAGVDRSQTVRFDTNYESLANGEFQDSSDSYSNAIYVGGKGQNDDRDIYEGEDVSAGTPSGLDRFESWDNQSSMTTEAEYEAEALSMLTQYGQTLTMSGNGLAKCPYVFREQYDIGDTVTVAFSGKSAKAQILSITEHWTWGSYDISFAFGKPQNNLADQLQLMLRKIQEASNKTDSTNSVRWYTIPTDTAMPKADVTYSHIGFIGTVNTGATFTLYLDDEKTGAKTYHVYFKQLGGTGKLTLTTGKAGATNLEMMAGTYVAIIYVDENGNVTNTASTPTSTIEAGNTQPATSSGVASAISQITETNIIYDNTITDCNNMYQKGKLVTYCASRIEVSNLPNTDHDWYIIAQCNPQSWSANNYVTQIATSGGYLNSNDSYTRHAYLNNGAMTWTSWEKLTTTADIVDSVTSGNMQPITSNAVYKKFGGIDGIWAGTFTAGNTDYIKLGTLPRMGNGFCIEFEIISTYNTGGSTSKRITIQQGTNNTSVPIYYVKEEGASRAVLLDKLYLCSGSNWSDSIDVYIRYNYQSQYTNDFYIRYSILSSTVRNFEMSLAHVEYSEITSHSLVKEYDLHKEGMYLNNNIIDPADYRGIHSFKVTYQQSKTIPFASWGYGLCMGNIDGAGNFCFAFSGAGSGNYAVNNWSTGSGFQNATLSGNVVTVGNANHRFTMTFNNDNTITFAWAGVNANTVFARIAFIGMSASII